MTVALAHVVVVRKAIARDAWISPFALVNLVGLSTALKGVVIAMTNVSSGAPSAKR
jgi:predicted membrane chloride channel (bestrophin family)